MRSSWRDDNFRVEHPTQGGQQLVLSGQEFNLLQKLRSLKGGSYTMLVVKTTKGRDGFHSFRLSEDRTEE